VSIFDEDEDENISCVGMGILGSTRPIPGGILHVQARRSKLYPNLSNSE
jgi:hypothetical protein